MRITRLTSLVAVAVLSFSVAACGDDGGDDDDDDDDTVDASADVDSGSDIDGAAGLTCAAYCDAIQTNCTGDVAQYASADTCLAACAAFPAGTAADTSGNTLGCRTYHAGAASAGPDVHCVHAGPGGAGACGDNCEGFCAIALDACPDVYADADACAADCANFTDDEPYDTSDTGGDTLACRLYHLSAATTTPDPHCGHIDIDSPPCQ